MPAIRILSALAIVAFATLAPHGASLAQGGTATLSPAEQTAALKATGAVQRQGKWVICRDDPMTSGARIESVLDLNGDGQPEAIVTEDGSFCHGHAGTGYHVLTRLPSGGWKVLARGSGMPLFLATKGTDGWPDLQIGGPGFCFPVERWNGKAYVLHRHEYEGKRCRPGR